MAIVVNTLTQHSYGTHTHTHAHIHPYPPPRAHISRPDGMFEADSLPMGKDH